MNNDRTKKLGEGLSNRHITMISIGGVIGAGLFVGSALLQIVGGDKLIIPFC
ncbi:site-specific recombinase, DNA invertase Pin [Acinetobacter baumannii]|nr:site-specific recombinase, DNA invertase Pin [Acinetobacter baumannii]